MREKIVTLVLVLSFTISTITAVSAQTNAPAAIVSDELNWISPAPIAGLQFTWIHGNETDSGLYLLRVKLESGAKIPAHTHPDQRISTVLSGTLYVGFGQAFDEFFDQNALLAIEAGDAYIVPAQTPHFIWAKTGDVEYQEAGVGPTATQIIKNN